jgi:hypothetical protein
MADKFRDTFPIAVSFSKGEQPAETKFDGWAGQTNTGLYTVEKALGDLWGERVQSKSSGSYLLSTWDSPLRPPQIANLARLIGPASALNPHMVGRNAWGTVTFNATDIPAGVHEWQLPYPPLSIGGTAPAYTVAIDTLSASGRIVYELNAIDGTAFQTHQASRKLCVATGDFHIDTDGKVYSYTATGTYGSSSHDYLSEAPWDYYDRSTPNVIPDMHETSTLCTITDLGSNLYTVALPAITKVPGYDASGSALTPPAPLASGAFLPAAITQQGLSVGDTIPEGFIYIWDDEAGDEDSAGAIVEGVTFTYLSTTSVRATSAITPLAEENDRYRIITCGTTITEAVANQQHALRNHSHNLPGTDDVMHQGKPIDHGSLVGNVMSDADVYESGSEGGFAIDFGGARDSDVPGNDHPQYLMRYGYEDSVDAQNQDNAMLGDLFMAAVQSDYKVTGDYTDNSVSSRKILFGYDDGSDGGSYMQYFVNPEAGTDGFLLRSYNDRFILASEGSACNVYIGDISEAGACNTVGVSFAYNYLGSENGLLSWSKTNNTFAFQHEGTVDSATVQMGELLVHSETAYVDPSSPGSIDRCSLDKNTLQFTADSGLAGTLYLADGTGADKYLELYNSDGALWLLGNDAISMESYTKSIFLNANSSDASNDMNGRGTSVTGAVVINANSTNTSGQLSVGNDSVAILAGVDFTAISDGPAAGDIYMRSEATSDIDIIAGNIFNVDGVRATFADVTYFDGTYDSISGASLPAALSATFSSPQAGQWAFVLYSGTYYWVCYDGSNWYETSLTLVS